MRELLIAGDPHVSANGLRPGDGARRRMLGLLDPDSLVETGSRRTHRATSFGLDKRRPEGDGVVAGTGTIRGRPVRAYAQDRRVLGGSLGEAHAEKIARTIAEAARGGVPIVGLNDSGGARIHEGVSSLDGYGRVFSANVAASGRVPQIAVVLGACAGGAVYSPALMDFVIMRRDASMFLTGPRVVRTVTGEDIDADALGGAQLHAQQTGSAHFVVDDDEQAFRVARDLLSYLPASCHEEPPFVLSTDPPSVDLRAEVPANGREPYDVKRVIDGIADAGSFLEVQPEWARNLVVGFARMDGRTVGIVANQVKWLAGVLDVDASEKGARFVRFCDAFGIPLIVLTDVSGFLPGSVQETGGIIRKGAKLLHAFVSATVPRITVVLRKAFGGAYIVMNSRSIGADAVFAWPGAELAVMGAEGAVDIIFRKQLQSDPEARPRLVDIYQREAASAELAAGIGSVDEIIAPEDTRRAILSVLDTMKTARRGGFVHDTLPI